MDISALNPFNNNYKIKNQIRPFESSLVGGRSAGGAGVSHGGGSPSFTGFTNLFNDLAEVFAIGAAKNPWAGGTNSPANSTKNWII